MTRNNDGTPFSRSMLICWVALAAACGQQASGPSNPGHAKSGAGLTTAVARHVEAGPGGVLQGSAAGDVKSGPGDLEIFNVRMDRQTSAGTSIVRQYANPGGQYVIRAGETIELWAEYRGASNPRFLANWGDGVSEFINCGSCLIRHTYSGEGRFTVTVTLDDRVATTVTRTFVLYTTPDFAGILAGSFRVQDGPDWTTNPPVVNCVETCAQLFGGDPSSYQCSTNSGSINRLAFVSGWGDGQYCASPASETFKLGGAGYNCGSTGCAYSAYVSDWCTSGETNYCFR